MKRGDGAPGAAGRRPHKRELNPVSRWREETEIEGLTLYDIHRAPRPVERDEARVVKALAERINEDLQCPICLSIMHNPVIVMECLHRFCTDCIQKCLRTLKNECPCCKVHIPSRRSLRDDHNFKALIAKLYPSLPEYKSKDERFTELATRGLMNAGYVRSAQQGLEFQRQQRTRYKRKGDSAPRGSNGEPSASPGSPTPSASGAPRKRNRAAEAKTVDLASPSRKIARPVEVDEPVAFVLRRHPNESSVNTLEREYLRSSSRLLVRHLKLYLGKKLSFRQSDSFEIIVRSGNKAVVIDDSFSLFDICQHFWQRVSDLVLHFRITPTR